MRNRKVVIAAALFACLVARGFAHSTLKKTVPASGSVLTASPEEVRIEFNEPARLTSVVVESAGQNERRLEFAPSGSATSFTIREPKLANGRNEVRWKALSKDGHPISGTIILVIKPSAPHS
ncbi:MAG TPA: copper resistance CopC family protein [Thermoanaerobaculia bacterium]|nr:copper resistance CopC family protein [Thermoanaerobaculia bacterium]